MRKQPPKDQWHQKVAHTRRGAMQTLRDIQAGSVDADDVDKLQNFVLFALALMELEGPQKWVKAKMHAELLSLQMGNR